MEIIFEKACNEELNNCTEISQKKYSKFQNKLKKLYNNENYNFFNIYKNEEIITEIENWWENKKDKFDFFVNLGIGGSSLGGKALINSFIEKKQWHNFSKVKDKIVFFFPDNVDPDEFGEIINSLPLERTLFNVVSKSGTTVETMAQLMAVWPLLKKKNLISTNIIFTTDPNKGELSYLAEEYNIKKFTIPPEIGGRFSVLSPVGLIPAIISGINVRDVMKGAKESAEFFMNAKQDENSPFLFSSLNYNLWKKKKNIVVLFSYGSKLNLWGDWFAQLWAESIGKKRDNKGVGSTPLKAVGATDQHSLMQLFLEGPKDKIIYFLTTKKYSTKVKTGKIFSNREKLEYLGGKELGKLLNIEYNATVKALNEKNIPNVLIELSSVSPRNIGRLILFFETAIFYAGELYKVNPFDQPAVEEIKKYIYGKMGRKGFEEFNL